MKKPLPGDKMVMRRYGDLLADIKTRIRQAQNRAVMSANAEMIRMYWDIGQMVAKRQGLEGWGKGLLRRLADDLKDEIPEIKGFSERNLQLRSNSRRNTQACLQFRNDQLRNYLRPLYQTKFGHSPWPKWIRLIRHNRLRSRGNPKLCNGSLRNCPGLTTSSSFRNSRICAPAYGMPDRLLPRGGVATHSPS